MPRQNRSAERWDGLLDATIDVFNQRGYDQASVKDIAEASGLAKPSLYHYITGKEDLLVGIITRSQKRLLDRIAALQPLDSALEMLRQVVYAHALFNIEYASESAIFFRDFRRLPPDKQSEIARQRDAYESEIVTILKEAQRRREASPNLDPHLTVVSILGGANMISMWYRQRPNSSAEHVAASFADLSVHGVVGTSTPTDANGTSHPEIDRPSDRSAQLR